jgi:RimJ/RimL family protein N-acetyltransferase
MLTALHIDDPAFDDAVWQQYFDLMIEFKNRFGSLLFSRSAEEMKRRTLNRLRLDGHYFDMVIRDEDRLVGWAVCNVFGPDSPTPFGFIGCDILPDVDPGPFAVVLARNLAPFFTANRIADSRIMATNPRTVAVADALGAKRLNRMDSYRLSRKDANVAVIREWLETYPRRFPPLKLVFFEDVPDRYMDGYIDLYRQFSEDMPRESEELWPFTMTAAEVRKREAQRKANNTHLYICALVDTDDRVVGHTNGVISADNPRDMYQAMTGIARDYRGRGLSKWLKAALFVKVGEDFPANEYVSSEMRAVNEPILAVNRQMGYKLRSQGFECQVVPAMLERFL